MLPDEIQIPLDGMVTEADMQSMLSAVTEKGFRVEVRVRPNGLTRQDIRITIIKERDGGKGGMVTP